MISQAMPLVSIIVPVYLVEKELPRCVESLLSQSYSRVEILLIDDGSPDESGAICERYAAADSRVLVFHQSNAGVSAARNRGLSLASGEYICFVDADDEVEENYVRSFVDGLGPEVDLVFQGICEIRNGKTLCKVPPRKLFKQGELTEAIALINKQSMFGYVCNKLYRRSIVIEHGMCFRPDISLSEDRIFALEYMLHVRRMQLVDTCAYRYYLRTTGQTMRRRSYQELKYAADVNLHAALELLKHQPSEQFLQDTRRMYVAAAIGYLTALFADKEDCSRCVAAFREFRNLARPWLPLYHAVGISHTILHRSLYLPASVGVLLMKLFFGLKRLKHEISA